MSFYTVVATFLLVAILSTIFWFCAPKQNQTVWRSTVILSMSMMFLMWAITYLCQLHPLIAPRRSDLRPEFTE
uniref:Vacuolar ATP synthase subunit e n=1 Tax=Zygosaccharomyces rouxii TaxID=4956 RepID=B2G4D5_ZYGRO|nr:Vacuolar ATP synthase subunit e [Zygosaccharomyces rouxii]